MTDRRIELMAYDLHLKRLSESLAATKRWMATLNKKNPHIKGMDEHVALIAWERRELAKVLWKEGGL